MEEWISEYIRRVRREIDRMISEIEESIKKPLVDFERGCLTPLHEIRETEDELIVYVDLPMVKDRKDIDVMTTEDKVIIEAKIGGEVRFPSIPAYSEQRYDRYYLEITLPLPVEAKKARAAFRNGILVVRLPKKIKRYKIEVE